VVPRLSATAFYPSWGTPRDKTLFVGRTEINQVTWLQEWKAIAARIDALLQVTTLYYQSTARVGADDYAVSNSDIIPACRAIVGDLATFSKCYETFVPPAAGPLLARLIDQLTYRLTNSQPTGLAGVQGMIVPLSVFRSEFEFHLRDVSAVVRNLVVRAFTHLQRLLIADSSVQAVWEQAYREDEPACERLGAAHLLAHGIWAFKASEAGERTDLVLGTHLVVDAQVESAADGLVLTEWKRVVQPQETVKKAEEAVRQMRRYSESILAGFELVTDRYVVLVSHDLLANVPTDFKESEITYHHVNVAVVPSVPSRVARRRGEPKR
jgi:hypothetical protein